MSSMSTTQQPIARRHRRTALVAGLAASALVVAACGGTTGEEEGSGSSSAGEDTISVFGAFATPLEEPWDGAIHAALTAVAEDGQITYEHVDDLATADEMERALRDIIASEDPDVIVGDAFAAEEAVREVAAEFPDTAFVFGSAIPEVVWTNAAAEKNYDAESMREAVKTVAADYPDLIARAEEYAAHEPAAVREMNFAFGLACVLDGLERRLVT